MLSFRDVARGVVYEWWSRSIDRSMPIPIDRSIDGRTTHGEGGEGRLGTRSAPICRGGCQSLSMLRDRSRVKGKKTRQGRLDWYSGTNTCTGSLEDFVLNKVQSWFPTAMVLQVWGSWQLFLRFRGAVHAVSIFDALRRSHIKMRQLSKWRIQVALVHEIGTTRTLDRPGNVPARSRSPSISINTEQKKQLWCNSDVRYSMVYLTRNFLANLSSMCVSNVRDIRTSLSHFAGKKRETTFICNCERKDESIFDLAIWSHLRSMTRSYNIYKWRKRCRIVMAHMVIVRAVLIDRKNDGNFSIIAAWEITRIDFPGISIRISVDGR